MCALEAVWCVHDGVGSSFRLRIALTIAYIANMERAKRAVRAPSRFYEDEAVAYIPSHSARLTGPLTFDDIKVHVNGELEVRKIKSTKKGGGDDVSSLSPCSPWIVF